MNWAQGELPTPQGPLGVEWTRKDATFTLTVRAPRGTLGSVALPTDGHRVTVHSGGRTLWKNGRTTTSGVRPEAGYVTVSGLDQGTHRFTLVRES